MAEIATDANAVIIDNFDFSQMKVETEKLLNDKDKLQMLQEGAYNTALKFKWETQYAHFEKYLVQLAKGKKRSD